MGAASIFRCSSSRRCATASRRRVISLTKAPDAIDTRPTRHLDLFDYLTNFGAVSLAGGMNLLLKMIGMPGKTGMDGSMVQEYFEAGRLDEIHRYCRSDVVQTYFLFLRVAQMRGQITDDVYRTAFEASQHFVSRNSTRGKQSREEDRVTAKPKISLIVITRDEEALIGECLRSAWFCDELVMIDSVSTDRTVEIAKGLGANVFEHEFTNYVRQKQMALDRATGDWVLLLDADEQATHELGEEILAAVSSSNSVRRVPNPAHPLSPRALLPVRNLSR